MVKRRTIGERTGWAIFAVVLMSVIAQGYAQDSNTPIQPTASTDNLITAVGQLKNVALRLPIAALLGAALAFRPRRRGTPPRSTPVIQTQIILAMIGALVLLVVGASVARAFGVVGVAGLIRYRAKIDDPKDASVMLATLAVGLASGVGLYLMAILSTFFMLTVLWFIESIEPDPYKVFSLKVTSKEAEKLQPRIEQLLKRGRVKFELRTSSADAISYEVQMPVDASTDAVSKAIVQIDDASAVEWEEHKKKS